MNTATTLARTVFIPVRTVSESNAHEHWRVRQKRAKEQRAFAKMFVAGSPRLPMPIMAKLSRVSPRLLDDDNLRGALKHVRDGIADAYGVDDRGPSIKWEYDQRKGKEAGVEVRFEAA